MRWNRVLQLLLPFALLGALSPVGAGDAKPEAGAAIALPGQAARGVVSGDHFVTVAGGLLVDVDLKQQRAKPFTHCYTGDPKLRPFVDVADGIACVASDDRLFLIDLSKGEAVHSMEYKGEVHGLGFAGENRVFVLGRGEVVVLDVAKGEIVSTISTQTDDPKRLAQMPATSVYQKVGKLLYVAESAIRIKIVDLEAGKLLDEMHGGYDWYTGLQVVGDKVFVRSINLSYGINNPLFGCFDLKTKKYIGLKHPREDKLDHVDEKAFDDVTLAAGPDDGACLAWAGKIYQYDAQGRQVGETALAKDDAGWLVGVWNGQALTAGKDSLRLPPLVKATVKED